MAFLYRGTRSHVLSLLMLGPCIGLAWAADPGLKEGNSADAPRLSPEQQRAAFTLAPGFSIELVTSEVQGVEKPVSLNFDTAGRLWTTTATEYPLDLNDPQHAETARRKWREGGRDRVLVIEAPFGPDPQAPRVFADGLVMPMSVLPYRDGAIVAHGAEMLRFRDTDGDGRADAREVLLRGFGVQDSHTMAHQLMWLPDNSILTIQGVLGSGGVTDASNRTTAFNYGKFAAFRPDGTGFRLIGAGLNNTWGVLLTRTGRMWVQEANSFDHPVAPFEEHAHFHGWNEEPYIQGAPWQPGVGEINLGSTGLSGLAQSEDREGGFPVEWQQRLLIANAVTGTVNSVTADPRPGGGWNVTRGPDLVTCADRRFRPVHLAFGPDACLYIVDWYNPVISHNEVARDHPARDKSSGRIWRVRHASQTRRTVPNIHTAPESALLSHLQSPVTWEKRAAWREIVDRPATSLAPALVELVRTPATPEDLRIHALWCLAGLGHFDAGAWQAGWRAGGPDVRFELVRALRSLQPPARELDGFWRDAAGESDPRVRREVARFLQSARELEGAALALALGWHVPVAGERIKGVQGETWPWPAYDQAFLNRQLELVLERQPGAADALAARPELLARLPAALRAEIERQKYLSRFQDGSITPQDLDSPPIRSAALACAESSDRAAAMLREYADATATPAALARECLEHDLMTPATLRRFAAPLALRLLDANQSAALPDAIDLAAAACTTADSPAFVAHARKLLAVRPEFRLALTRAAIAAGIKDPAWCAALARETEATPAARAAAWTGWFDSATDPDRPGVESSLREWLDSLPPAARTEAVLELAATPTGARLALTSAAALVLAQDEPTLARLSDELAERAPAHPRLAEIQAAAVQQRTARTAARASRVSTVEAALASGRLTGRPEAAQPLFTTLCLSCHSASGQGASFAPPLDGSARRERTALLTALIDPEAAVENVFRPYHLRLRDGTVVEGFLKSRHGNRITLQSMGGTVTAYSLLRTHTARHLNGHSLMPPFADSIDDAQLADLVAAVLALE